MTAPDRVRIALAQYPIEGLGTRAAYDDKIARWVAEAADGGAELAVFPEYGAMERAHAHGLAVASDLDASLAAVASEIGELDALHADLARRHRVHILAASAPDRRADGRIVNVARLFAPSGRFVRQEKLMMTPFERRWGVIGGKGLVVARTALGQIGIAICYDSEFPLLVRALAEAGARLILVPSCTERVTGWSRVRTAAMARALESQVLVATSPTVGTAEWSPAVDVNTGAAGVFAPADRGVSDHGVIAEGELNRPGFVRAVLDFPPVMAVRHEGEVRTFEDWPAQPGAAALSGKVKIVDLD